MSYRIISKITHFQVFQNNSKFFKNLIDSDENKLLEMCIGAASVEQQQKTAFKILILKRKQKILKKRAFLTIYKKTKKKPGRKPFQTKIFTAFDSPISILLFLQKIPKMTDVRFLTQKSRMVFNREMEVPNYKSSFKIVFL